MRPRRVAKVVLVGDSGVGKSTILSTYTGEPFSPVYFKTRERDIKTATVRVRQQQLELQIWDTPGDPLCRTITAAYMREEVQGAVIVFDVTKDDTYYNVPHWVSVVNQYAGSGNVKFLFVGNKNDQVGVRRVNIESGVQLANQYNGAYIDASARTNENVHEIFQTMAERICREGTEQARNLPMGGDDGQEGNNSVDTSDRGGFRCTVL
ncbi:uncharacterized protein [Montipora capricornis]|uniref:uncharacterized protein n=1 Tax=Montipora capricornis TaxID=246305 RepID=UPI0035F1C5E8